MTQDSPSKSKHEPKKEEYQYESEGEETLGSSARALYDLAGQNYARKFLLKSVFRAFSDLAQVARASLLAYTRCVSFL